MKQVWFVYAAKILCVIALLSICSACSDNSGAEAPDIAITLEPFPPRAGDSLLVYYKRAHPKAEYPNIDSLYVEFSLYTDFRLSEHRALLQPAADSALSVARFFLPPDAFYVRAAVTPRNFYMSKEFLSCPVLAESDTRIAAGAYGKLVGSARSLAEAYEQFREAREYYPRDFRRWTGLLSSKVSMSFPADSLRADLAQVEALYNSIHADISPTARIDALAVCALATAALKDWQQAQAYTQKILDELEAEALTPLHLAAASTLVALIDMLTHKLMAQDLEVLRRNAVSRRLCADLVSIAGCTRHPLITATFLENFHGAHGVDTLIPLEPLIATTDGIIHNDTLTLADTPEMVSGLAGILQQHGYVQHTGLLERAIRKLEKVRTWNSRSPMEPVSQLPIEGFRSSAVLDLAKLYLLAGDSMQARRTLWPRFGAYPDSFEKGAVSFAALLMSEVHREAGRPDSAEKYCAIAWQLGSPFADTLLPTLQALRRARGQKVVSKTQILERFRYLPTNQGRKVGGIVLATPERKYDISRTGDSTIFALLFSTESCSACVEFMPAIVALLQQEQRPDLQTLIVSTDPAETVAARFGKAFPIAEATHEVELKLGVFAYPMVYLIRGGTVLYSSGLNADSHKHLAYELSKL